MTIETLEKLCKAMVLLMKPLVEIVIHDRTTDTIFFIDGGLSRRKTGDPSLLNEPIEENLDKIVYEKVGFDGRVIKSISVPIEDKWLICINCDVCVFEKMQELSQYFLNTPSLAPESLFKNDWQERLNKAVHACITQKDWTFNTLNGKQKKEIVHYLYTISAFEQKHAADYIAQTLEMGRATIFNYLKEWKSTAK